MVAGGEGRLAEGGDGEILFCYVVGWCWGGGGAEEGQGSSGQGDFVRGAGCAGERRLAGYGRDGGATTPAEEGAEAGFGRFGGCGWVGEEGGDFAEEGRAFARRRGGGGWC